MPKTLLLALQIFSPSDIPIIITMECFVRYHQDIVSLKYQYIFLNQSHHESHDKGQLISKGHFSAIVWTKKPTKFFKDFCPSR